MISSLILFEWPYRLRNRLRLCFRRYCCTDQVLAHDLATAGFDVVGAATRGGRPETPRREPGRPIALILGNEERGLAPDVAAACTRQVTIPGSGRVESLNVSVAAAVLMWELFARR